jgi:hypothetical protein
MLRTCVQISAWAIVSGLLVGCSTSQVQGDKASDGANDQAIVVPEFSIAVKLSETAQRKLRAMHESVLTIVYFDGDP